MKIYNKKKKYKLLNNEETNYKIMYTNNFTTLNKILKNRDLYYHLKKVLHLVSVGSKRFLLIK